jgi:hypothetical protein
MTRLGQLIANSAPPRHLVYGVVIVILSLFLRFERVSTDPLWFDEGLTLLRIEGGSKSTFLNALSASSRIDGDAIHALVSSVTEPSHLSPSRHQAYMPAFYAIERAFNLSLGLRLHELKIVPVLFGSLLPLAVWSLIAAMMISPRAGIIAALLTATHPLLVAYSVELRSYSLLLLCICVYLRLLIKPLQERRLHLAALSVVLTLGALTHLIFLPIAWITWFLAYMSETKDRRTALYSPFWLCVAVSLVAAMPVVQILSTSEARTHFTARNVLFWDLVSLIGDNLSLQQGMSGALSWVGALLLFSGTLIVGLLVKQRQAYIVLATLVAPFLGMVFFDLCVGGVRSTVPRYSLSLSIFFVLIFAIVVDRCTSNSKVWKALLCSAVMALFIASNHSVDYALKGGSYAELSWFRSSFGERGTVVVGSLTPNQLLELSMNGGERSRYIIVRGSVPSATRSEISAALTDKIPVLAVTKGLGDPPYIGASIGRWREVFRGPKASFFLLEG